ncbi:MAG: hypothetical protein J2P46_12425, partial [Zavarzinella sp.]|nr:hypothetical protein [Zavarzinella sp.]
MAATESRTDRAKAVLDSLQAATKWLAGIVLAAAGAAMTPGDEIHLLGAALPRGDAALLAFCILGGVMVYLARQFVVLHDIVREAGEDRDAVAALLKTHQWAMNPFSESGGPRWYFTDVCGVALLAGVLCLGCLAGIGLAPRGKFEVDPLLAVGVAASFVALIWSCVQIVEIVWDLRGGTKVFVVKLVVVLALI